MRKVLLAVAMLLGVSSAAMAEAPLVLKSGTIQAIVNGQVQTYKAGDTLPQGKNVSQLSATSDAVITSGGTTITVPNGAVFQAGATDDGKVDVRSNSGGAVTVATSDGTATVSNGREVVAKAYHFTSIAGIVSVKTVGGATYDLDASDPNSNSLNIMTDEGTDVSETGGLALGSILPPPPPNTTQNIGILPVS